MKTLHKPLFELGHIVGTAEALQALAKAGQKPNDFLWRHATGDWGELGPRDWAENNRKLEDDLQLLSAYTLSTGVKIWIITEADRTETTILLPEEY